MSSSRMSPIASDSTHSRYWAGPMQWRSTSLRKRAGISRICLTMCSPQRSCARSSAQRRSSRRRTATTDVASLGRRGSSDKTPLSTCRRGRRRRASRTSKSSGQRSIFWISITMTACGRPQRRLLRHRAASLCRTRLGTATRTSPAGSCRGTEQWHWRQQSSSRYRASSGRRTSLCRPVSARLLAQ